MDKLTGQAHDALWAAWIAVSQMPATDETIDMMDAIDLMIAATVKMERTQ